MLDPFAPEPGAEDVHPIHGREAEVAYNPGRDLELNICWGRVAHHG